MSMLPFFPSLCPPLASKIWFDMNANPEAEVLRYERDHHTWMDSYKTTASELHPLGKVYIPSAETDDEDANDDSDDSDSHDEEDDDTNDRVISGAPERAALGEDVNINDDAATNASGSQ